MCSRRVAVGVGTLLALHDATTTLAFCNQPLPHLRQHQLAAAAAPFRHRRPCCPAVALRAVPPDLEQLSRRELQALAKQHGLRANSKNADLIEQLQALGGGSDQQQQQQDVAVAAVKAAAEEVHQQEVTAVDAATARQRKPKAAAQQGDAAAAAAAGGGGGEGNGRLGEDTSSGDQEQEEQEQEFAEAEQWSEERISRKIGVMQRKLRDVMALEALAARDPDALNPDQHAKVLRKTSLQRDIAALENVRRQAQEAGTGSTRQRAAAGAAAEDAADAAAAEPLVPLSLPKKLATVLSYCRVSTTETCELLVAMGRVTVNGAVATNSDMKVDILTDEVIANGVRVEIPEKFDNTYAAETMADGRQRRGQAPTPPAGASRKRTGPLPKSERPPTWKQLTRYSWKVDGGLMARKVRGIKPKDGVLIDRDDQPRRPRGGGGGARR